MYLSKYNRDVPKTWDELLSTSKYIFEEEKKLNNTIIPYNGLLNGKIIIYYLFFFIYFIFSIILFFILFLFNFINIIN